MSNIGAIVLTTLGASALVLALAATNLVREFRRLRALQAPRPWFLICRRVRGMILPPRRVNAADSLDTQTAWLSWDLRWVTCGETLARVTLTHPENMELCVDLEHPIALAATSELPAVSMDRVQFIPRNPRRAAYNRAAVRGTLRPILAGGLMATAEIVVYPG